MKEIGKKERLFCLNLILTGNGREAAARAGYAMPGLTALKLMNLERVKRELERLRAENKPLASELVTGLRRLAFGSAADALRLLYCDEAPPDGEIEKMDLFCVSDIKRPKGGGMEIKFFDRLKALESLARLSALTSSDSAATLIEALDRGAGALMGGGGGDEK